MSALHPRTAEVVAELAAAQQELQAALDALPATALERRPADGGWSIGDVVEHLMLLEDSVGRLIGTMLKQVDGTTDVDTDPIAPTMAHFRVAEPLRKLPAPEPMQPTGVPLAQSLARQAAARARLIDALTAGSGRALHTASFPHPFIGPLNGYQWALLVAQHQRRHLVQIHAIAAAVA